MKSEFEQYIISILDDPREGVVEVVSYTMHEMRWEVVRSEVASRLSDSLRDVSYRRLYEAILDSFSDSWRDRDLYARYGA